MRLFLSYLKKLADLFRVWYAGGIASEVLCHSDGGTFHVDFQDLSFCLSVGDEMQQLN